VIWMKVRISSRAAAIANFECPSPSFLLKCNLDVLKKERSLARGDATFGSHDN
jgi:hypothetical protein